MNKVETKRYNQIYCTKNKDILSKKHKEYYQKVKDKIRKKGKLYRKINKVIIAKRKKIYADKNKDYLREYKRKWREKNKRLISIKKKRYFQINKKKINLKLIRKRKFNKDFALLCRLRIRLWNILNTYYDGKQYKSGKYGINYNEIIEHLKPFPENLKDYHVDHIKPLCSFDLNDPEQIKIAFAPQNHQWLLAKDNLRKGAKREWQSSF